MLGLLMHKKSMKALLFLFSLSFYQAAFAQSKSVADIKLKAEIALENQLYYNSDDFDFNDNSFQSVFTRLELKSKLNRRSSFQFRGFARTYTEDDPNSVVVLEEMYLEYRHKNFRYRFGSQYFNWSATEAFHPADVVNSRNLKGALAQEEKFGEPMLSVEMRKRGTSYMFFYMPSFIQPSFPSVPSSKTSTGVNFASPILLKDKNQKYDDAMISQFGFTYNSVWWEQDVQLHILRMQDRQQAIYSVAGSKIQPIYFPVTQVGGTLRSVLGSNTFKLETAYKDFDSSYVCIDALAMSVQNCEQKDHLQVALGYEYNFQHDNGSESSFFSELQTYELVNKAERAYLGIYQRDFLLAYRYAFNDEMAKEIFFSTIYDLETSGNYFVKLSYNQRLADNLKLDFGVQAIFAKNEEDASTGLQTLDSTFPIYLNIISYF